MTAPIVFTAEGVLLTHGPLALPGITPSTEVVKVLAEATLALVLFSDSARVGLHQMRADLGPCLRLLGIGLPLAISLGTLATFILPGVSSIWLALLAGPLVRRYGPRLTPPPGTASPAGLAEVPERRLIRRAPAASQPAERGSHS